MPDLANALGPYGDNRVGPRAAGAAIGLAVPDGKELSSVKRSKRVAEVVRR